MFLCFFWNMHVNHLITTLAVSTVYITSCANFKLEKVLLAGQTFCIFVYMYTPFAFSSYTFVDEELLWILVLHSPQVWVTHSTSLCATINMLQTHRHKNLPEPVSCNHKWIVCFCASEERTSQYIHSAYIRCLCEFCRCIIHSYTE